MHVYAVARVSVLYCGSVYCVVGQCIVLWVSVLYCGVQVERVSSEKAVSTALAEEREKHNSIIADMKVCSTCTCILATYSMSPIYSVHIYTCTLYIHIHCVYCGDWCTGCSR